MGACRSRKCIHVTDSVSFSFVHSASAYGSSPSHTRPACGTVQSTVTPSVRYVLVCPAPFSSSSVKKYATLCASVTL
jgi:hypothetical protein